VGPAEVTTVFRNLVVNPAFAAADFQFVAPPGVAVIDADQELKQMEEQARQAQSVQQRKSAFTSATEELARPAAPQ
jgi:hypothetical protein